MITQFSYQVGGSLTPEHPTYIHRQADDELYRALKGGEFCYVLDSRQMGKSSLLVRTKERLSAENYRCTYLDLTQIGSQNITPAQWYKGVVSTLWLDLGLVGTFNLKAWWREADDISILHRLSRFVEMLLQEFAEENLIIFIDEIDSILALDFTVDDFFAWIRFCYNQRAQNPQYNRLTFALFGVATPADLIGDKSRTPFNIGQSITLSGFTPAEVQPLVTGLRGKVPEPEAAIAEILAWTSGQPFLTQKLCQLTVRETDKANPERNLSNLDVQFKIAELVETRIIQNWESQDEPEHLKTIRDRILRNEQRAGRMLGIYQQLLQGNPIKCDDSREHIELLLSGLLEKRQGYLQIKNRIYENIFNPQWVETKLQQLRPYSQAFNAWMASKQTDKSRLLRGQALKEAQLWAQGKSLSDFDYQFLAASVECDRLEVQQALEAQRAQEIEARLIEEKKRLEAERRRRAQEQKTARLQRLLLIGVTAAFGIVSTLGAIATGQYRKAVHNERLARISEIKALISSSQGQFASHQKLNAAIAAIKAKRQVQRTPGIDPKIAGEVTRVLQEALYGLDRVNRLSGHRGAVLDVDFSSDGELIATAGSDKTVKIWTTQGRLVHSLPHDNTVFEVKFSPKGDRLVAGSLDGKVRLWSRDGTLLTTIQAHSAPVWSVAFSPDGEIVASASGDTTVKLWHPDGSEVATLTGPTGALWSVAFSPDNQTLAASSVDGEITRWRRDGSFIETLVKPENQRRSAIWDITFSPDGNTLVSANADRTVKLWHLDGSPNQVLSGHTREVNGVAFSPDGKTIASVSADETVKLWTANGTLLQTLRGHGDFTGEVAFSADSQIVASAGGNRVTLWKPHSKLSQQFALHQNYIWSVDFHPQKSLLISAGENIKLWTPDLRVVKELGTPGDRGIFSATFSPDGEQILAGGDDGTISLWQLDGTEVMTFQAHSTLITTVAFSPDGDSFASSSDDNTIKVWTREGQLRQTLEGHDGRVWHIAFSPDGEFIASVGEDGTLKLWHSDGTVLNTIAAHDNSTWGVAISVRGEIATASLDGTIGLWQPDGTLIRRLQGNDSGFHSVAFSPDGEILAGGSTDNTVVLWNRDGEQLATAMGHRANPIALRFSPDGKTLASSAEDQTVILWNVEEILAMDVLSYTCGWVRDYLHSTPEIDSSDRTLCDGIGDRRRDRVSRLSLPPRLLPTLNPGRGF